MAELLEFAALTDADRGAWRDLAAAAVEPNPFFEPEFCEPLARGTGQAADVRLLVERDGPAWSACLPVRRSRRWHRVPLPNLSTWRAHDLYALLGTPLLAPGATLDGIVDGLLRARGTALVAVDWVAAGGPVEAALQAALGARRTRTIEYERFERAALRRRPENDYAEVTVSSKHRREYRRQRRKLGEEVGEVTVVDRAADPAAVQALIDSEAAQAVAARGQVLAADPAHARFFAETCAAFAALGRLQLLELRAGDRVLAHKCNLLAGDGLFTFKIAFDDAFRAYSPGMQLELEMLNFFHDAPTITWMDSCADANNAMINRLWPDRRTIVSTVLATSPRAGPAVRGLLAHRNRPTGD